MAKKELTAKTIIKKDIGDYSALEAVKNSEGGKLILASLQKDILSCIDTISSKYTQASHSELISLSAKLSERLNLFRTISRSSKNKKLALDELKVILAENPETE